MRRARSRARAAACAALLGMMLGGARARAEADPDPWLGKDKALHFAASASIAAAGYGLSALVLDARWQSLAVGGGLAAAAGVGKEALDLAGYGDPSWRDLAWDGIGAVFGLALAFGVDLALRGISPERPLLSAPAPRATVTPSARGFVVSF